MVKYIITPSGFSILFSIGPDSGRSIGCYADDSHDRDLPYEPFVDPRVDMWPPMCIHHCFNHGYLYAGLQVNGSILILTLLLATVSSCKITDIKGTYSLYGLTDKQILPNAATFPKF